MALNGNQIIRIKNYRVINVEHKVQEIMEMFYKCLYFLYDEYLQSTKIYTCTELRITLLQNTCFHKIMAFAKVVFARNIEVTEPVRVLI